MDEQALKLRIRKARKNELDRLAKVYISAYHGLEQYAYAEQDTLAYVEWLYRGHKEGVFVAEVGERIVGFVACNPFWHDRFFGRTCEIHEIVVENDWKGKGIGRSLLERTLLYAKKRSCRTASLWVGEENTLAVQWYERHGFRRSGRWGIWLRMKKPLQIDCDWLYPWLSG